jgi:alpha-mannosidase
MDGTALIQADAGNVVIETVKRTEDGNCVIVRLYESLRRRGEVTLTPAFELAAAWRTDLLERDQERLALTKDGVRISVHPYQIATLRLVPLWESESDAPV